MLSACAVAIVLGSVVTTIVRRIQNSFDARVKQCMLLRQLMGLAKSYDEWHKLAVEVERLQRIGMPVSAADPWHTAPARTQVPAPAAKLPRPLGRARAFSPAQQGTQHTLRAGDCSAAA